MAFEKTVQVSGTFVADVGLQACADGTNWVMVQPNLVSGVLYQVFGYYKYLRCYTTAYTSGTPVVYVASHLKED